MKWAEATREKRALSSSKSSAGSPPLSVLRCTFSHCFSSCPSGLPDTPHALSLRQCPAFTPSRRPLS
eukprot:3731696-Rhodomonas_salina.1